MSLLRIHLPSNWPEAEPDAALPWCRIGARGEALESGVAAPAAMPAADACELVTPAELVLLTRARLPRGSKQKMRQLLPYAIEDKLGAEPEAVHVAAGPALADGQTALAVIDKAWLARALARLAEAGLRPRSAWPEILLPVLPGDGWAMVWDGRGGFLRSGAQAGMSLDGGSAAQPPAALALSAAEARAAGALPARLQLRLAEGAQPPDTAAWGQALGMAVEVGAPWAPLAQPEVATGGINLLQGAFEPASPARKWWPALRVPLILGGLLVVLHTGATAVEWWQLKREKQQLQASMEKSFRQAFPDARVVVDAPLQMQRNLAELRSAAGQVTPLDFVPLLSRAAAALDPASRSRLRAVRYEAGQLSLELALPDRAAADALLKRLTGVGLACQLQDAGGEAPLTRIVITGSAS
jgi:general secretion pathway protein L